MKRLLSLVKPLFASVTSRRGFLKIATVGLMAYLFWGMRAQTKQQPFWGMRAQTKQQPARQRSAGMSEDLLFSRFTDRARKVMRLADEEARRLRHEYLGTEHILLGLLKEGTGVAINVLKNLDVDLQIIRSDVENIIHVGPERSTVGKLPLTPRAKRIPQLAMEEARRLGHNYVGTEHLLLGIVREPEGVAAQVLRIRNLELWQIRQEVLDLLGYSVV
jgi:hypothetical protein